MTPREENRRQRAPRETVLKSGQIVFRDTVIDCAIMDISADGARVRTAAVVPIPDRVTLHVRGGAVFPAFRRWARGTEIGLSFAGPAALTAARAHEALLIAKALREEGLGEAVRRLRDVNFFDDPELRRLAEQAEAAHGRLEAALNARAAGSS